MGNEMAYLTVRPIRLFLAALVLHILARIYYGSPYHQALFTVLTFVLVADGLWALGRMIADGQTWLPAIPAYRWVMRFIAVGTLIVGFTRVRVKPPLQFRSTFKIPTGGDPKKIARLIDALEPSDVRSIAEKKSKPLVGSTPNQLKLLRQLRNLGGVLDDHAPIGRIMRL